jgi:hypothetical protein
MELPEIAVLTLLAVLAISAVSVSILILHRGRLYRKLQPESRPRRWVLFLLLFLFAVFIVWFPVWTMWPHSLVSRSLTLFFGIIFFLAGITFKWFSGLADWLVKLSGRPLR